MSAPTLLSSSAPSPTCSRTRGATPADQPVSVRARRAGHRVLVSVVDRGPGIDRAELERIFQPFYRGRRAAGEPWTGSGLGLAIAKGFVEANGGTVSAQSLPGQGTSFIVSLPVSARLATEVRG